MEGGKLLGTELHRGNVDEKVNSLVREILKPYIEKKAHPAFDMSILQLGATKKYERIYTYLKENVKPGEVITYGELGKRTGFHQRTVANAMRSNKFPLLIPCHRVVSKEGVGGFSQGIDIKLVLLEFEKEF